MSDLLKLSATELMRLYRRREVSPVAVTEAVIAAAEAVQPHLNAFTLINAERARIAAALSEARWVMGEPAGLLDGVPVTIKDNIAVNGLPGRRGSKTTPTTPHDFDAPVVARLKEHGAVVVAKTTMPEFGWKGVSDSPLTGLTRNPFDRTKTTGGSSAGAAVAAALNVGCLHIGTDGAGSIRIPGSFSGVYGIKQSFGRVPAYPPSPYSILAHVGPMTRTVTDAALMLSVLSEPDDRDIFAWNTPAPDYRIGLDDGVRGLRIAWSPKLGYVDVLDAEVGALCAAAAERFAELGAHVEEVDPGFEDPFDTIFALWSAGSAAAIAPFSAADRAMMDQGFVANAKDGEAITAAGFISAFTGRAALSTRMAEFHQTYDLLLTPTMPIPAFEVGHDAPPDWILGRGAAARRSLAWTVWSPYTYPFNLTMQPAASVPAGLTAKGLPVGLQIVGPMGQDALVLRASRAFESISPFPRAAFP